MVSKQQEHQLSRSWQEKTLLFKDTVLTNHDAWKSTFLEDFRRSELEALVEICNGMPLRVENKDSTSVCNMRLIPPFFRFVYRKLSLENCNQFGIWANSLKLISTVALYGLHLNICKGGSELHTLVLTWLPVKAFLIYA